MFLMAYENSGTEYFKQELFREFMIFGFHNQSILDTDTLEKLCKSIQDLYYRRTMDKDIRELEDWGGRNKTEKYNFFCLS